MQSKSESVAPGGHRYEPVEGERCSVAVVNAVADVVDCHPLDLPEVLGDVVDADALDSLVGSHDTRTSARVTVSFEFCGCVVTVAADGAVVVAADSAE